MTNSGSTLLRAEIEPLEGGLAQRSKVMLLHIVDDTLRHESDSPSIGLLLCRKKALTVECALRNVATPIGVAEFVTDLAQRIESELNSSGGGQEISEDEIEASEEGKKSASPFPLRRWARE